MAAAIKIIQDADGASLALHPLRIRILEALEEPSSASSLAGPLGVPRQHLNYHLRELEKAGLVEFVEERRRGNCVERIYQSVARSYVISPRAFAGVAASTDKVANRKSAEYLVALGSQLIEDIAQLDPTRPAPVLAIETQIAFTSSSDRSRFAKELADAITDLAQRYHSPSKESEIFRLLIAAHPAANRGVSQ